MRESIYENIIENSKIAYLKINCIKNNEGKYIGVNVIEQNKEFEKLVKIASENNILYKEATECYINNWINVKFKNNEFDLFIRDTIKKGNNRIEIPLSFKEETLMVDIYYLDQYFIIIYNIQYENIKYEENVKVYNWAKDLNGVYIDAYEEYINNPNIKRKNNDIIGKKDIDLWNLSEVKTLREHEEEVIYKRGIKTFYNVVTGIDGRKKHMEYTLWPLLDCNNNIIGTRGTSIEINNNLIFEKNMVKNEENFREITKYCESAFIIRDREKATYISPAFNNIFETRPNELYKDINKLNDFFKRVEYDNQIISKDFDFHKSNEGTKKVILDNNKEKWIWYKFLPIRDTEGNVTKRVGILTDVTEKQNLEEEKNQLKLDFFANLSHELRTPINLISSTIQLIKMNLKNLPEEDANKLYKYMDIMEINSFRLVKLINNLLDSTKIDSGFVNFNPINADIIKFVEDICDSVVEFIKSNNMQLVFDTNSEEEIVLFDPEIIERIMLNILSNAIKFNKSNGTIYVNIKSSNDEIIISIEDEGIGIPKEKIDTIFKRFEQVHNKSRIEKQGSGIGLYLVKSLIELHQGTININSEVNKGSEFIITIPKKIMNLDRAMVVSSEELKCSNANIEFSDI